MVLAVEINCCLNSCTVSYVVWKIAVVICAQPAAGTEKVALIFCT